MAQAQTYKRKKNFAENNPDQTDLAAIDNEFDAVALSVNGVIQNIALLQKDDGSLANNIVGLDNVTEELVEALKGNDFADACKVKRSFYLPVFVYVVNCTFGKKLVSIEGDFRFPKRAMVHSKDGVTTEHTKVFPINCY